LGMVVFGAVTGFLSGGIEMAIFSAVTTAWFGQWCLRGAGKLVLSNNTLTSVPHQKSESERREEITPISRKEDCHAFLEERDGQIWFVVARGDKAVGPFAVVECEPWDSFDNFEEGSHKQWFRPRGVADDRLDWGTIIAQSRTGRVMRVAETLSDHAVLVELLITLQNTFIAPRAAMLREFNSARSRTGNTPQGAVSETPTVPF
jgi:hypothetical protein